MAVFIQPPRPETDFGDFVATIVELKAWATKIQNQLLQLALIAVTNGWAGTMASHLGISRSTVYDWWKVARMFGEISPDVPLWLYVAAARMAMREAADEDEQKKLANDILDFCIKNGVTPSEMKAIIRHAAPPVVIEGEGEARYPGDEIVLIPKERPRLQPPYVRFRIVATEPGDAAEQGQSDGKSGEEIRVAIDRILGSRAAGS